MSKPKPPALADLFPMKNGQPNPSFTGRASPGPNVQNVPRDKPPTLNRRLRDAGLLPIRWDGTLSRLRDVGVPVESHPEVEESWVSGGKSIPGQNLQNTWWAPRWAVLVAEADPCSEDAKDWALAHAYRDEEFRDALDSLARLIADGQRPRQKMADFVMAEWPGPVTST